MLERKVAIEKENKRLLEKMALIVSGSRAQPNDARTAFNSSKLLPKDSLPAIKRESGFHYGGTGANQKSLNIVNRKKEYLRIQEDLEHMSFKINSRFEMAALIST